MNIKIEKCATKKEKPDFSDLGFGKYFTDHMFIMNYSQGKGWFDPRVVPYQDISISPAAMVFHYGQAVFEGLKCYRTNDNKLNLFRPKKNFERLNISNERLCIPEVPVDMAINALKTLLQVDEDWIPSENGTSLYIRPFIIATESALGVHASRDYLFMIILSPVGAYYKEGFKPVKICIEEEYVRSVKGSIGFTKGAANYAISLKGQVKAQEKDYTQVLWLDGVEKKYIEEVGTMNIFFKINGEVVTPSLQGSILAGVTRDSVIEMLKSWNIPVVERQISVQELYDAHAKGQLEEAFGTGTAAVISPVGKFSWEDKIIDINNGEVGEISQKLYNNLTGIQYGTVEDTFGWITKL